MFGCKQFSNVSFRQVSQFSRQLMNSMNRSSRIYLFIFHGYLFIESQFYFYVFFNTFIFIYFYSFSYSFFLLYFIFLFTLLLSFYWSLLFQTMNTTSNNLNYPHNDGNPTNHYLNQMNYNKGNTPYGNVQMQQMNQFNQVQVNANGMGGMGGMTNMGGMGMLGLNFGGLGGMSQIPSDPRVFIYNGNQITFKVRLDGMSYQQIHSITDAMLSIDGQQSSEGSLTCITCTILWGALLILPLFIMCFDCWKRCVYPCYQISPDTYSSLAKLTQGNLQNLVLLVKDNNFDKNKAQILYQIVSSQPRLVGFTFINYALGMDYKSNEYANFEDNMKPFKKLPLITDLRWFRQVVRV